MTEIEALQTIMGAGYEGMAEYADGHVTTVRFWKSSEDAIPIDVIKRVMNGTMDTELANGLKKLLDWWYDDRGKYTEYF